MANQTIPLHNVYGGHVRFPKGPVTVANNFTGGNVTGTTFSGDNKGAIKQERVYGDYARRYIGNGGTYNWGEGTYDFAITPQSTSSIIKLDLNWFGEVNGHDAHGLLQYSINEGSWTNFPTPHGGYRQQGHFKWGEHGTTSADVNSTPRHSNTMLAHVNPSSTLGQKISYRVYTFNHNGIMFNTAWHSTHYESAPSFASIVELDSTSCSLAIN